MFVRSRRSSSAQWLVQQGILSASKVILHESDLILMAQVDRLNAFRGQRRTRSSELWATGGRQVSQRRSEANIFLESPCDLRKALAAPNNSELSHPHSSFTFPLRRCNSEPRTSLVLLRPYHFRQPSPSPRMSPPRLRGYRNGCKAANRYALVDYGKSGLSG